MHVTAAELNAIKTLAHTQRSIAALGSFPERANLEKRLKQAKKIWWSNLRTKYNLPAETKFAIELDGDLAGELRYKGSGGVPYQTWARNADAAAAPAPQDTVIDALNPVLQDLGLELIRRGG